MKVVLRFVVPVFVLGIFWFTFEFQYMWYRGGDEAFLLRTFNAVSLVVSGLLIWSKKHVGASCVIVGAFCAPFVVIETAFNWYLFGLLLFSVLAYLLIIRLHSEVS